MTQQTNLLKRNDVKIVAEKTIHQGFFRLKQYQLQHRLFAGSWSKTLTREVLEREPIAAVLPFDPHTEHVVLIEQFRAGALHSEHPWLVELVAGIVEPQEKLEEVAQRETQEETGLVISTLLPLYQYWVSPGGSSEYLSLFLGKVDAKQAEGIHGAVDEGEDIRVLPMPAQAAFAALTAGRIQNAVTIIGLQWLQLHYDEIMAQWR